MDIQEKESKLSIITMGLLFAITVTAGVAYYSKTNNADNSASEIDTTTEKAESNRIASLENSINQLDANQSKLSGVDQKIESSNAALQQQIVQLEKQIAALTESIQTAKENQSDPNNVTNDYPDLPLAPQPELSIDQIFKQEEQKALLRDQLIATSHTAEAYDDIWANDVTSKIHKTFNNPEMPKIKLTNADCRTTMCLVEFEAPLNMGNEGEYNPMYENELISALGEDFPSGTIKSIAMGENLAYTLYLAKTGHELPGLEDENPTQ